MIAALLPIFLLGAQAADAPDGDSASTGEEIVVTAKAGRVALVFDKGADGKLHNCRVFVSSGVDRIDDAACSDLPDCVVDTHGRKFCGDTLAGAAIRDPTEAAKAKSSAELEIGKLIEPDPVANPAVGPAAASNGESEWKPVTLPPLPKDETHSPAITISGGNDTDDRRDIAGW